MEKSLLICCEKFYVLIHDIVKKNITVNADFFEELKDAVVAFAAKARLQGFTQAEMDLSQYALIALIDELISYYYPQANHHWPARSLQLYYYQTNIAGHLFFENLNSLLLDGHNNQSVLEIYYFCLQLNFQGQHAGNLNVIADYRQRLKGYVSTPLTVETTSDDRDQGVPLWLLLSVLLFLFLMVYAVFIVFFNEQVFRVTTDLDAYAEQLAEI